MWTTIIYILWYISWLDSSSDKAEVVGSIPTQSTKGTLEPLGFANLAYQRKNWHSSKITLLYLLGVRFSSESLGRF